MSVMQQSGGSTGLGGAGGECEQIICEWVDHGKATCHKGRTAGRVP